MMKNIFFNFGFAGIEKRIWMCAVLIALLNITHVKSASSSASNEWIVYNANHQPCIRMEATIDLNLTYLAGESDITKMVGLNVPSALTVDNTLSSCSKQLSFDNKSSIDSQVLHLNFPNDSWAGWSIEFLFTQSSFFHASSSEFTLYGVIVVANYSSQESKFPGHQNGSHTYTQAIYYDNDRTPSAIADDIYANKHYSYFCTSAAEYPINNDEAYGLKAWITLRKIRVQAYAPEGTTKFGDREICPQDQTNDDLIPVVVGGVLAGLVVITLVIYLVYRSRQPPSVLYLTNPHSHFEDVGTTFKPHGHDSIEDEEESSSIEVGNQSRVARHLQQHSNYAFEE